MENQLTYLPFLSWLWLTIIAIVISLIWWFALNVRIKGGYWFQLVIAWLGAWLGTPVFGNWIWNLNHVSIISAVLGSIAAIFLVDGFAKIWSTEKE